MNGQNRILVIAVSLVAIFMLALAAGCTVPSDTTAGSPAEAAYAPTVAKPSANAPASAAIPAATTVPAANGERQTIRISGSTTVLPIVQKAADQYMATHANADIQVSGGG